MKHLKHRLIILFFIPILISIYPTLAIPEATEIEAFKGEGSGPIVVRSNSFEIDNTQYIVTFTGDVDAKRDDFTINCEKMLLYYQNLSGNENPGKIQASIDKIVATGKVRISRQAGGLAMAEKAVYYSEDERVVLTGKPVVKQGDDFVEGSTITLFLKENRSIVEGSEDSKARAVLFPKRDKR